MSKIAVMLEIHHVNHEKIIKSELIFPCNNKILIPKVAFNIGANKAEKKDKLSYSL